MAAAAAACHLCECVACKAAVPQSVEQCKQRRHLRIERLLVRVDSDECCKLTTLVVMYRVLINLRQHGTVLAPRRCSLHHTVSSHCYYYYYYYFFRPWYFIPRVWDIKQIVWCLERLQWGLGNCESVIIVIIIKKELIIVMFHKVAGALYIVSEKLPADVLSLVCQWFNAGGRVSRNSTGTKTSRVLDESLTVLSHTGQTAANCSMLWKCTVTEGWYCDASSLSAVSRTK